VEERESGLKGRTSIILGILIRRLSHICRSHKVNNAVGQVLIAKRLGKTVKFETEEANK
jgi:tryptophan synthase beta subunit